MTRRPEDKIKSTEELQQILTGAGKKVVFTNGCFDLLHAGHINYLFNARAEGDILVVGLNSDTSVRDLKGPARPFVPEQARALVLAGLECVDYVVLFSESNPLAVIKAFKPDVLVKGGDWKANEIVGKEYVESCGGKVKIISYLKSYSTTSLIKTIADGFGNNVHGK